MLTALDAQIGTNLDNLEVALRRARRELRANRKTPPGQSSKTDSRRQARRDAAEKHNATNKSIVAGFVYAAGAHRLECLCQRCVSRRRRALLKAR